MLNILLATTIVVSPLMSNALKPFAPLEIKQDKSALTIVLNEKRVTEQIYKSVVNNGICLPVYLKKADKAYLNDITEINILNQHSYQGYVLENPRQTCEKMGSLTSNDANIELLSNTHLY